MPDAPDPRATPTSTVRDFTDLTIELRDHDPSSDTCTVAVLPSGVGETDPVTVPLGMAGLAADLGRLERKVLSEKSLIGLGERLGNVLVPGGPVRDLVRAARDRAGRDGGVRLRLLIRDGALTQIPWEYAYVQREGAERHRSHFLALDPQVSLVRHEPLPEAPLAVHSADGSRLRVVIATAGVTHADVPVAGAFEFDPIDVGLEGDAVSAAVRDLAVDGVTVDASRALSGATRDDLTKALLAGADIFHFAGHGLFAAPEAVDGAERATPPLGYLLLQRSHGSDEGDALAADDLAMMLQRAGVRVAVLGACESARRDDGSPWNAVAPALVRRGLPAAVGMQYPVIDTKATAFSRMLYTSLAAGLSLDEAVSAGRQAMLGTDGSGGTEWGVPVLYMRARSGVLFPQLAERASRAREQLRAAVDQVIDTIARGGEVTGIVANAAEGTFSVRQSVKSVQGSLVGMRIGTIGR